MNQQRPVSVRLKQEGLIAFKQAYQRAKSRSIETGQIIFKPLALQAIYFHNYHTLLRKLSQLNNPIETSKQTIKI